MYNDAALTEMAEHIATLVTHMQLHSSGTDPGAGTIGSRFPVTATTDTDGDTTYTASVTGLPADTPVTFVSYWTAETGGTNYGGEDTFASPPVTSGSGTLDVVVVESGSAS